MSAAEERLKEALTHHRARRLGEATKIYRETLSRQGDRPDVLYYLGVAELARGDADMAVEHIERSIVLNPDHAEAHCNPGHALKRQDKLDATIAAYQKTLASDVWAAESTRFRRDSRFRRDKLYVTIPAKYRFLRAIQR